MANPNRPYRVGMARPEQRYIETEVIYPDMSRGVATVIPREFPYTWNPVNGVVPQSSARLGGVLDDVWNKIVDVGTEAGQGIIKDGTESIKDHAGAGVEDLLNSTAGKQFLDAVKVKAGEGVVDVFKKNGGNLIVLAVAAGIVGGAVSSKMPKTGTLLAAGAGIWAIMNLLNAVAPGAPAATPKKK